MNTKTRNVSGVQFRRPVAAAAVLCLVLPFAAWSSGVVTECTESNLRAALTGGGTVTFACDGTITLASTITNDLNTTLDGSGHQITISGGNAVRVFWVNAAATLTLANLTVANGTASAGAAILNSGGTVNATNCTFTDNTVTDLSWDGVLGGAILNESGLLHLSGCDFARNQAQGILVNGVGGAAGKGGAIYNGGTGVVDLCKFLTNVAAGAPGGWQIAAFFGGDGSGGAIFNVGTLEVKRTTFSANEARGGASALGSWPGDPGGDGHGGAICNQGNMRLDRSTLANNVAIGGSGATGVDGYPWMDIATDGGAGGTGGEGAGGGLFNSGNATAVNSTLARNSGSGGPGGNGGNGGNGMLAGGGGGNGGTGGAGFGAVCDTSGLLRLTNCTVALNTDTGGDGGAGGMGGDGQIPGALGLPGSSGAGAGGLTTIGCFLVNTLLSINSGNCYGWVTDGSHNLSSDGSCAFTNVGSLNTTNPLLGPLAENGGPTLTMALLPGSPAIDAGDTAAAPPTDQRGFPRPAGLAADIGAFEYGSMLPVLAINRSGETDLEIVVCANSNQPCRLFASSNLMNWQCVATNQIGPDGTTQFQDNCGSGETQKFYRVSTP